MHHVYLNPLYPYVKCVLNTIGLGSYNYINPTTFYWRSCTKPCKWVSVSILSLSTICLLHFWTVTEVLYFVVFDCIAVRDLIIKGW